jgi:Glycosyl transferases group 1
LTPRIGLQVFGTRTGLGYQTRALYRYLLPTKTMLIDLSKAKRMPLAEGWYGPEVVRTNGPPTDDEMDAFLDDLDVVFCCETPLNYRLFSTARERGIRTVLAYNYEFCDYLIDPTLPLPTVFAAPTSWYEGEMKARFANVWPLPVPVDVAGLGLPSRRIDQVRTVAHIAGQPTVGDRAGTLDFITTARACADLDVEWLLYCQVPNRQITDAMRGAPIELVTEVPEPGDLYRRADLLVQPRRYGGLNLPVLEALACGIPTLMPDCPPNGDLLPADWLIPSWRSGLTPAGFPPVQVDTYQTDRAALADAAIGTDPARTRAMTADARRIGASVGWDVLLPTYLDFLDRVMELQP